MGFWFDRLNNGQEWTYLVDENGTKNTDTKVLETDKSDAQLTIGDTTTVTATATDYDGKAVLIVWSSSDENIATVNDGKITAVGLGKTTITVMAQNKSVEINVTVNPKTEILNEVPTINAEDKTITVGDTFDPLKDVTASDKEDGDLTSKIEVINNTVKTDKAGTYEVTYQVTDKDGATATKTIKIIVKNKEVKPTDPTKPDKPTENKPNKDKGNPKTGDQTNVGLFTSLLTMSGLLIAILVVFKKKKTFEHR